MRGYRRPPLRWKKTSPTENFICLYIMCAALVIFGIFLYGVSKVDLVFKLLLGIGGLFFVVTALIHVIYHISKKNNEKDTIAEEQDSIKADIKTKSSVQRARVDIRNNLLGCGRYNEGIIDINASCFLLCKYNKRISLNEYISIPNNPDAKAKIIRFDYNKEEHIAKIEFEIETRYRKIVSYTQQNYIRYPNYSGWRYKTKSVSKTLPIKTDILESLNNHIDKDSDHLISLFAEHIVLFLDDVELIPSWLKRNWLKQEYEEYIAELLCRISDKKRDLAVFEKNAKIRIEEIENKLEKHRTEEGLILKKLNLIRSKALKPNASQKKIRKYGEMQSELDSVTCLIDDLEQELEKINAELETQRREIEIFVNNAEKQMIDAKKIVSAMRNSIKSLLFTSHGFKNEYFIPLEKFGLIPTVQIMGVYIIRNTKNGRCYVGQSKDVFRRLKQHFKGTIPNNPIFAEDYYTTLESDRSSLFEFRIIRLNTKDELDNKEKEMIEKYDAYETGYNRTTGNR